MEDGAETSAPLKLMKLVRGHFMTTKDSKDCLSDIGMLAISYAVTILKETPDRRPTKESVDEIFATLGLKIGTDSLDAGDSVDNVNRDC